MQLMQTIQLGHTDQSHALSQLADTGEEFVIVSHRENNRGYDGLSAKVLFSTSTGCEIVYPRNDRYTMAELSHIVQYELGNVTEAENELFWSGDHAH